MSTVESSAHRSWANITGWVRAEARAAYGRDLCLFQRILYVQSYPLAKIWHTAHVFLSSSECTRQLVSVIAWYICQSATFRVAISMLQRRKSMRMGVNRRSSKMSCPPAQPNVGPSQEGGVSNGDKASVAGLAKAPRKPPTLGEDTEDLGVLVPISTQHGVHWTPRAGGNA